MDELNAGHNCPSPPPPDTSATLYRHFRPPLCWALFPPPSCVGVVKGGRTNSHVVYTVTRNDRGLAHLAHLPARHPC